MCAGYGADARRRQHLRFVARPRAARTHRRQRPDHSRPRRRPARHGGGETKTVEIAAADAYGEVVAEARQTVPREVIPADIPLEVGTRLQMQAQAGQTMPVTVTDVGNDEVTLDANHPLAGKHLTFQVEPAEVKTP